MSSPGFSLRPFRGRSGISWSVPDLSRSKLEVRVLPQAGDRHGGHDKWPRPTRRCRSEGGKNHFWHQLTNLPEIMPHHVSITIDDSRAHWIVTGPAGRQVEWDAEFNCGRTIPNNAQDICNLARNSKRPSGVENHALIPIGSKGTSDFRIR